MQIRSYILFLTFISFFSLPLLAQRTISGFVKDSISGERLIGATLQSGENGTVTDHNGFFALLSTGSDSLHVSYVGYSTLSMQVKGNTDTLVELNLVPGISIGEVEVTSRQVVRNNMISLTPAEINALPSITGKPDVMRALQLMPGVMGQSEGSGLLLVRGGNPGENMYLFDHVPLIYVNHFGGFMSVFNPDIINSVDVYKGNFPARYGGKLSSIVNITQREGNQSGFKGSYHLGITDLSLSLEGPLSDKTTLIFSGRKTLFDALMMAASGLIEGNGAIVSYGFHDINAKFSWKPNTQNSFHVNLFQGDDYWRFKAKKVEDMPDFNSRTVYVWGNWMLSGGWKHISSAKLFGESNIAFTRYRNREQLNFSFANANTEVNREVSHFSSFNMVSAVSDWKYFANPAWTINFGVNSSLGSILPVRSENSGLASPEDYTTTNTLENAVYVDNNIELPLDFELQAGLRGVHFASVDYDVLRLEPRASLTKYFRNNQQVNVGYMQVNQFSHLLFTPGSIFSNEVWIPSDNTIKPAISDQFNLGWMGGFKENQYQAEVNFYYKSLEELATYKEGFSNLRGDPNWQDKIETGGTGEAWGAEFLLRKTRGRFTGFVGYTYSRATRKYKGINNGETFTFDFDRPHSISLNINHEFNKRSSISVSWVYQTGLPYTPVTARYMIPSLEYEDEATIRNTAPVNAPEMARNISQLFEYPDTESPHMYEVFIYGERNSARMRNYHRLDVSYTLKKFTSEDKLISSWTFGLYNAYNRQNPVYYYYNTTANAEIINPEYPDIAYKPFNLYQLTLFPVIPNISYRYYFGQKEASERKSFKDIINHIIFQ
jgi:hypothetical protein